MEVSATHSIGDSALLLDDAPTHASELHQGGMLNGQCVTQVWMDYCLIISFSK